MTLNFANKVGLTRDGVYSGAFGYYLNEQNEMKTTGTQASKDTVYYQLYLDDTFALGSDIAAHNRFGIYLVSDGSATLDPDAEINSTSGVILLSDFTPTNTTSDNNKIRFAY